VVTRRRRAGGGRGPRERRSSPGLLFAFIGGGATAAAALLAHQRLGWHWLIAYLAAINLATVVLYGYDKLVSGGTLLRVPERSLHFFALAGGTPGAFLAQGLFRHKTVKRSFRLVFWMLALLQAAVIGWALWRYSLA
jgi:uncharacterized membrane protein YsdA (DUF1294 family)